MCAFECRDLHVFLHVFFLNVVESRSMTKAVVAGDAGVSDRSLQDIGPTICADALVEWDVAAF